MNPLIAQQQTPVLSTQSPSPVLGAQAPAPYTPYVAPAQVDFSQVINMIVPLLGLMLVFGMLMPMMRSMSEAFR